MKNQKIRTKVKEARLFNWEVAEALNMSESNFSRLLRHDISEDMAKKIDDAIKSILRREQNE